MRGMDLQVLISGLSQSWWRWSSPNRRRTYESDSVIDRTEQGESCPGAKRYQDGRGEEENDAPFLRNTFLQ